MDQFGVRGDVTGMHPPLQNVAAFSHSAAPHRVENQNFGVPGQWQMTESHMRLQGQPMPNNMQRDDYQYDPTLAQTALSFPGMESSAWEANIQDATQVNTTLSLRPVAVTSFKAAASSFPHRPLRMS